MDAKQIEKLEVAGQGTDVSCSFITGAAGTGKTYMVRKKIEDDPGWGILCATTGIAAVNLSTVTLNSVLKYFNTESLEDSFVNGFLEKRLRELREDEGLKRLVIDEVSMMDAMQLDIIKEAMSRVNEGLLMKGEEPIGIVLTGDFCQLPPIKSKWAFEADCWSLFEQDITRLDKIWRQDDPRFLQALNAARRGAGGEAADILSQICRFKQYADSTFDGTTVLSKNNHVDRFNQVAHAKVRGELHTVYSYRWGNGRKEWEQIPMELSLKTGAFVMILSNIYDHIPGSKPGLIAANGDCGHVKDYDGRRFLVKLVREDREVAVAMVTRPIVQRHPPRKLTELHPDLTEKELRQKYSIDNMSEKQQVHWDRDKRMWILGAITYYPLRLAYATTVHKSQGLSLDTVQVSVYDKFFGSPNMAYVALSRARTPEGLEIIGTPQMLAKQINTAPEVVKWL